MSSISELVTIDINGVTYDVMVTGYYTPAYDGGRDEPSEPEDYNLERLHTMGDKEISDILCLKQVRDDIVKQLKEQENDFNLTAPVWGKVS